MSTLEINWDECPLHRRSVFVIRNVSTSQFSVARYYGGIVYNNEAYVYVQPTDELVRADVLRWMKRGAKPFKKKGAKA